MFCQIFCYLVELFCQCLSPIRYSGISIYHRNVDKCSKNDTSGILILDNSYVGLCSGKCCTQVSVEMSPCWIILNYSGKQWMLGRLLEKLQILSQVTIMFWQKKIVWYWTLGKSHTNQELFLIYHCEQLKKSMVFI